MNSISKSNKKKQAVYGQFTAGAFSPFINPIQKELTPNDVFSHDGDFYRVVADGNNLRMWYVTAAVLAAQGAAGQLAKELFAPKQDVKS